MRNENPRSNRGISQGQDGQRYNLTVRGNINAWDIDALDIDARDIICEVRKKKSPENKTIARIFVEGSSKIERKEW